MNILDVVKPVYIDISSKTISTANKSVIKVYQNGKIEINENVPPTLPFYPDLH